MPFSSSKSNTRLPSNIPLRTIPHASASTSRSHETHDTEEATSFLQPGAGAGAGVGARAGSSHTGYRIDKPGSDSEDDTDSWVETGDIGDQFDAEDPLRARLNDTLDESVLAGLKPRHAHHQSSKKEKKHVRIHDQATYHSHHGSHVHTGVVDKEAIEIPEVISIRPSKAQRLISSIMPGSGKGFTGKPLMYVPIGPYLCRKAMCSTLQVTNAITTPVISQVYSYH